MRRSYVIALCNLFLFACLLSPTLTQAKSNNVPIGMVTGPKTGTYIAIGQNIADVAKKEGIQIQVKDSQGSIDNIKRIASSERVSLGIVQSDVLGFLSRSKNPDSRRVAAKLRMVVPFYQEEVHVLARAEIQRFSDLQGKRVVVGDEGSGSLLTAVNLFSITNVNPAEMIKLPPPEGMLKVLQKQADAIIFVGGKPVKLFKNLEEMQTQHAELMRGMHFIPLNEPKILEEYAPTQITSSDYNFVTTPVPTVAVTAVLVAFDFSRIKTPYGKMQCKNLGIISKAIRDHMQYLRTQGHPKWQQVNLDANVAFWKKDECSRMALAPAPVKTKPADPLANDLMNIIRGK